MQVYMVMAVASAVGLIWRIKVAHAVAASCGTIGASFTAAALATGSLWGAPCGALLEWDPRIIFELVLLFQFLGYVGLRASVDDVQRAEPHQRRARHRGCDQHPIIHYSVEWWNSLHQTASVMKLGKPSMPLDMLVPLAHDVRGFLAAVRGASVRFAFGGAAEPRTLSQLDPRRRARMMATLWNTSTMGGYAPVRMAPYGLVIAAIILKHPLGPPRIEARAHRGASTPRHQGRFDMTPARKRRLYWVLLGILGGRGIAGGARLSAFQKNVMFSRPLAGGRRPK